LTTAGAGNVAAAGDPARFAEAHRALLADGSIQFEMQPPAPPPPPPAWLQWLDQLLAGSGPLFKALFWIAVAAAVAAILYYAARWISGGAFDFLKRGKSAEAPAEADWRPDEAPARALLSEADALAAEGRYDEAAHLLLFRSIEEIDRRRPALVKPALTSRDIAGAPQLPSGPRGPFQQIVRAVERSLFGGRSLGAEDWTGCRAAYEEFAFAREWQG
jgi:hypothetical protein